MQLFSASHRNCRTTRKIFLMNQIFCYILFLTLNVHIKFFQRFFVEFLGKAFSVNPDFLLCFVSYSKRWNYGFVVFLLNGKINEKMLSATQLFCFLFLALNIQDTFFSAFKNDSGRTRNSKLLSVSSFCCKYSRYNVVYRNSVMTRKIFLWIRFSVEFCLLP